jgi:flagellar hook-associated protein 2
MREIGISTGATTGGGALSQDAVAGKLVIDDAKLTTALTNNPSGVQQLLGATTGINGFAQSFEGILNSYTQTGGILDIRVSSAADDVKDIGDQIAAMDQRLDMREALLKSQFAAMESIISGTQSMGNALNGQLASLMGGSG